MNLSSLWMRFKGFVNESIRVLKVTRKPSKLEFQTIVKVSGLGMLIIGFLGFVITMVKQLLFP
jgi:protein transport protein SEC61 subunit gamma and related proteins